jgi:hypothetical protein
MAKKPGQQWLIVVLSFLGNNGIELQSFHSDNLMLSDTRNVLKLTFIEFKFTHISSHSANYILSPILCLRDKFHPIADNITAVWTLLQALSSAGANRNVRMQSGYELRADKDAREGLLVEFHTSHCQEDARIWNKHEECFDFFLMAFDITIWSPVLTCTTCTTRFITFFLQWLFQPIQGPGLLFSSVINFLQTVGRFGRVITRRKASTYTHTEQHKHRTNTDKHPCLAWDSNPWSQRPSEQRQFMP